MAAEALKATSPVTKSRLNRLLSRKAHTHRFAAAVGVVVLLMPMTYRVLATSSPGDPFAFFRPSVTITPDHRSRMDLDHPVARIIAGKDPEVGVWAAASVNIDGNRLVAWMRRIEELKKSQYLLAIGRVSDPPRLEDFRGLSVDDEDISEIADCRAGDCDLKLTVAEITALQHVGGQPGDLQQRFRRLVLDRVNTYLSGGRIGPYTDSDSEVWPGQQFDRLLEHSPFLTLNARSFAETLRGARAAAMPGVESFLYWSKERLGDKATISVTDVRILRGDGPSLPDVVVAGKQIFATRYVNASLGLTALVRGEPGRPNYLVYVNRSELDMLHGTLAGVARWLIERRLKAEAVNVLRAFRRRLESGEPPAGAVIASP
jgi:hypothetical protein